MPTLYNYLQVARIILTIMIYYCLLRQSKYLDWHQSKFFFHSWFILVYYWLPFVFYYWLIYDVIRNYLKIVFNCITVIWFQILKQFTVFIWFIICRWLSMKTLFSLALIVWKLHMIHCVFWMVTKTALAVQDRKLFEWFEYWLFYVNT